jgi:ribosome-associated translation inhibitor RaiA
MIIQFSSAHSVNANEELKSPITALLSEKLDRFSEHITRLDVHLSDHANTFEQAAEGAVDKLKASLNSAHGRAANHHPHAKDVSDFAETD